MALFGKKDSPEQTPTSTPNPNPGADPPPRPMPAAPETSCCRFRAARCSGARCDVSTSSHTLLGNTITIKGDITAEENVTIEGTVEGTVETSRDVIVAPEGRVKANIRGATVVISGKVRGNVAATNKVDLTSTGQLEGNIQSPKLAIAESALFKGSIDMSAPPAKPESKK